MTDAECRRTAMVLSAQLPRAGQDRRRVLDYMRELVPFLDGQEPPRQRDEQGPGS